MAEHLQSNEHALMRGMGINDASVRRRLDIIGLAPADQARIASVRSLVVENAPTLAAAFFEHLQTLDEARGLFASRDLLEQARSLKREHLIAMTSGDYGVAYVEQRLKLAAIYNRAGIESRVFLAAFHHLMRNLGALLMRAGRDPMDGFETFMSLKKVAFYDIGIITDALVYERERTIRQQSEAIRELSTPVLQIRERMLLLPIIGVIDTHRA